MLISGLFKIVCATCPAHAVIRESVRYQDELLIHYECHGKTYLAAMHPYFTRVLMHKSGERCQYSFNVVKPDVSFLPEPIEHIYVLDTELDSLDQARVIEMQQHARQVRDELKTMRRPNSYTEDEWLQLLEEGRKTLALLTRFSGDQLA